MKLEQSPPLLNSSSEPINQHYQKKSEELSPTLLVNLQKPEVAKPGWNAFHYFNYFYRNWNKNDNITFKKVRDVWQRLPSEQREPFLALSRKHMNKYKNSGNKMRKPSAAWNLKKRLSLGEYRPHPETDINWNTWASQVMQDMIKEFKMCHTHLSEKEAGVQWREQWMQKTPDQQRQVLKDWFGY